MPYVQAFHTPKNSPSQLLAPFFFMFYSFQGLVPLMENFQSLKFGGFNVSVGPWDKLPDIASKFTAMHEEFS